MMQGIIFVFALGALIYSGGLLVKSLVWMGRYLKLSEYTLAFILVAFATSLPELFVGVTSALKQAPALSFGNLVGSNVLNITLVLGASILWSGGIKIDRTITKRDMQITLGMVFLPLLLLLDGSISRADGLLLIFFFIGYIIYLSSEDHKEILVNSMSGEEFHLTNFLRHLTIFTFGVVLLLGSSSFVVSVGLDFARALALPLFLMGVIVSIGTALPELVFGIRSVHLRHPSMSLGNAFGSMIVNFSLILGLVALIHPIVLERPARAFFGIIVGAFFVGLVQSVARIKQELGSAFGALLIAGAVGFLLVESFLL